MTVAVDCEAIFINFQWNVFLSYYIDEFWYELWLFYDHVNVNVCTFLLNELKWILS